MAIVRSPSSLLNYSWQSRVFAKTQTEQRPYYAAARFICKIGCAETDIPFKIAVFEYVTPVL